jgi:hypothetical protein
MKRLVLLCGFLLIGIVSAFAPPEYEADAQTSCFSETGFCVTNPAFAEYFRLRGGVRILGYPVSRSFTLDGFEVQFFQRVVLQMQGSTVQRLNVLDPNIMPMTRANQSVFPQADAALAASAPQVGTADYPRQVVEFVRRVAPDAWNGQQVGYFALFNTTVPVDIAFAGQTPNPDLVTLLNLEIWGLPTSKPAPDPGNGGFIYQRFQRGIMHYRAEVPVTEGILVGEYLKAVMTGRALPPDLAEDMQRSRFLGQYKPGSDGWLARPAELPNTDLTAAFKPGTGPVEQPNVPPTATPSATRVPEAVGPAVTIQIDDAVIDSGQIVNVTMIGHDTEPLYLLELYPVLGNESPDREHSPATDSELAARTFRCDSRLSCATVWSIAPITGGRYTLWARGQRDTGAYSDWIRADLRVREAHTPTSTPTPTMTLTPEPETATPTPTATATLTPESATATPTATLPPAIDEPLSIGTATPTPTPTLAETR